MMDGLAANDHQLLIHKLFDTEVGKLTAKAGALHAAKGSSGAVSVNQLI